MKNLTPEQIEVRTKLASDFEKFAQEQKDIAKNAGIGVFYVATFDIEEEKKMQKISSSYCTATQVMQTAVRVLEGFDDSDEMKMAVAKSIMTEALKDAISDL